MNCEHELSIISEEWFDENTVCVVCECGICKRQFHGTIKFNNLNEKGGKK